MRHIILGASAAGISAASTIRELDEKAEIVVVSIDDKVYSRCMLHHLISGERDVKGISFIEEDFFEKNNINWIKGKRVVSLDSNKKILELEDGSITYDKLLIATGASSFIPPVKNLREGKNVFTLRNIEDAEAISDAGERYKRALIIGAGLVGIDAAVGLVKKNVKIDVVEMGSRILPLQLDTRAAAGYEKLLGERGVNIRTGVSLQEVLLNEDGFVKGAVLSDGTKLECDFIVAAAGVRPNVDFLKDEAIEINRGIVINEKCETNLRDVYAAGDVCFTAPIWPIAVKQGRAAGFNMVSGGMLLDDNFGFRNSMNFFGLETVSLGMVDAPDESFSVEIFERKGIYKKIIHKYGIIYGAILQGDISYCGVLTYIIKNRINVSNIKKNIFKINFADFYDIGDNGEFRYKEA